MRVLVASLALLVAGCLSGDEAPGVTDGLAMGVLSGLPLVRETATLDAPPVFAVGEWWTYRIESLTFPIEETFTLVVAGVDGPNYLVGFPLDADRPGVPFTLHLPGIGEVARADLTFDAHDAPFKLLDFPLVEGHAWEGTWWSFEPMSIAVEGVDGMSATMSLTSGSSTAAYTYDAELGAITSWERTLSNGALDFTLELIDHGFGHQGPVRVPYGQDLLFCHGQAAVVMGIADCAALGPSAPVGEVQVPEGYDVASLARIIGPSQAQGQDTPQLSGIRVTDPHGEVHASGVLPGQPALMEPFHVDEPTGTWTYEVGQVGAGTAIVEGVVYRALDVELPSGCWLSEPPSESAGAASCT